MAVRILVLAALSVWLAVLILPDDRLHVVFCNVGQGDAVLITHKSSQILVDGGPGKKVLECLERYIPFYDRRIEAVILTHGNADHSRGLEYVRERYTVIQNEPALGKGQELGVGKIKYTAVWPDEKILSASTTRSGNDQGIVGKVSFGDFDVLLTADVATKYYSNIENGVEVVKVPHHGSKTDWEPDWWKKARPVVAVISVGKNSFGHPTNEVIKTLGDLGIKILRTDVDGDIEIVSDGIRWEVRK